MRNNTRCQVGLNDRGECEALEVETFVWSRDLIRVCPNDASKVVELQIRQLLNGRPTSETTHVGILEGRGVLALASGRSRCGRGKVSQYGADNELAEHLEEVEALKFE